MDKASFLERYKVNVIVDNAETKGGPVVEEANPTYNNLVGRIERKARFGAFFTNFMMIRSGSRAPGQRRLPRAERPRRAPEPLLLGRAQADHQEERGEDRGRGRALRLHHRRHQTRTHPGLAQDHHAREPLALLPPLLLRRGLPRHLQGQVRFRYSDRELPRREDALRELHRQHGEERRTAPLRPGRGCRNRGLCRASDREKGQTLAPVQRPHGPGARGIVLGIAGRRRGGDRRACGQGARREGLPGESDR